MELITADNQRKMEQEALRRTFIQIPMEIFYDPRLTPNDKIIYGRINTFDEFFESRAHTAELLNVSTKQVQRSITKLLDLGYIEFIHNDGRGNRYRATEAPLRELRMRRANKVHNIPSDTRLDEIDPSWTNCPHEGTNCPPNGTKCPTEYKESLNEQKDFSLEDKSSKDGKADGESSKPLNEEAPKRYGSAEINDLLDLWAQETGFSHHGVKMERYAISGLLRQYGPEATKALIRRVGRATRSRDRFAPQIAKPSQLRGKYEKLTALTVWENRKDLPSGDGPDLRKLYETPAEYREPQQETTLTKEELHQHAEDIRERYKGTAYERIFARRAK